MKFKHTSVILNGAKRNEESNLFVIDFSFRRNDKRLIFLFFSFILILNLTSCGVRKSIKHIPDIKKYSLDIPKVKTINDSTFSFNQNYLTKNKQQLWELYIEGNPLQLGYNNGALTQDLMQKQEEIFFSKVEGFVPSKFKQKLLRGFLKWYNRKMYLNVREDFQAELYGSVRNNKEFEALGKEIEYQELEIQLSEKRIKEYGAKIAHKEETLNELTTKINDLKNHLKFKKEELEGLVSETQKEEEYLLEKSKEFAAKIDERLLASYHRIRTSSSTGLAVVGLERGAPKGSFFTIPPQKQMEIAQRKKIIIDEHSGKILVDDELVMEENEKMKSVIKF